MAKAAPIRYTIVPANLKIVKVLVNELLPYGDPAKALKQQPLMSPTGLITKKSAGSEDSWESDEEDGSGFNKGTDDKTQELLVEFFKQEGADPRFQELFAGLTDEERKRCLDAVQGWDQMVNQRSQLGQ